MVFIWEILTSQLNTIRSTRSHTDASFQNLNLTGNHDCLVLLVL